MEQKEENNENFNYDKPYSAAFSSWLAEKLYIAYREARKSKRSTRDEHIFDVNELENIIRLRNAILSRTYRPSGGTRHIIEDPVRREIIAAPFTDRVVHHFINDQILPWWETRLLDSSYSCRKNKGTDYGVNDLQKKMRRVSHNGAIETYVIKLDIEGYFIHIDHEILYQRLIWGLKRQFPNGGELFRTLRFLIKETVFDNPREKVVNHVSREQERKLVPEKNLMLQPEGHGLVIGNYTSQVFSNIMLDPLDRFITNDLGYKYYGRYVDDFFILVPKTELKRAIKDIEAIRDFLFSLKLTLHPRKIYVQNIKKGIPFLGRIVYIDHIVAGKRFRKSFYRAAHNLIRDDNGIGTTPDSIQSYIGSLMNIDGQKLTKEVFDSVGWDFEFQPRKKSIPPKP